MSTPLPLVVVLALGAAAPAPAAPKQASELGGEWPTHASGKKVTVDAKTPNEALKQIADAAGWGLVIKDGKAGNEAVAFSLKKIPVEEALQAVLSVSNLHAERTGSMVTITRKHGGHRDDVEEIREDAEEMKDAAEEEAADAEQEAENAQREMEDLVADAGGGSGSRFGIYVDSDKLPDGGVAPDGGLHVGLALGQKNIPLNKKDRKKHHHRDNGNDQVEIGQDIDIPVGAHVGSVVAVGGSVHIGSGAITNDVVSVGGSIDVDPGVSIDGDAVSVGGSTHLGAGAVVSGDTTTLGGQLTMDPGAVIKGQQVNLGLGRVLAFGTPAATSQGFSIFYLVSKLAQFVLFFCLGALLLMAAPNHLANIEAAVLRQPIRVGLAGFLMTLAIPVLALLLVVTIVGIPLVAVELFGVALAALMGFTAMAVLIGRRLQVPVRGGGLLGLAVGTGVVVLLIALPWIGFLLLITTWFLALGAALTTRFGSVAQG